MATTSIWSVKGWLGKLVIYVENPNKTTNPQYYEKAELTEKQAQTLLDVIDYAADRSAAASWRTRRRLRCCNAVCSSVTRTGIG